MPNITAGTFALNCAFLGIPCISYIESDPQRLCQPQLSVDKFDLERAVKLAKQLKTDSSFYKHCSEEARSNYKKYFSEEAFLQHMNKILS
jgi:predicted glycosyltransferase